MSHNIILLTWEDSAKAFEGFHKLKDSYLHNIHAITLIKRQDNGQFKIEEQINPDHDNGLWSGSLLGALIGILGGPFGILLGFTAGAMIGGSYDIDHAKDDLAVLGKISKSLPLGTSGILIDIFEENENYIDDMFKSSNVTIYRWDFSEVQSEIEASLEAWNETQRIANFTLKQEKKAEHKAKWDAFIAKFHPKK